jgi:hypothetical protein
MLCTTRNIHAHLTNKFEFIAILRLTQLSSRQILAPEDSLPQGLPTGHGDAARRRRCPRRHQSSSRRYALYGVFHLDFFKQYNILVILYILDKIMHLFVDVVRAARRRRSLIRSSVATTLSPNMLNEAHDDVRRHSILTS